MTGLRKRYRDEIVPRLMEAGGYSNVMEAPRLEKVVVGIGLGEAILDLQPGVATVGAPENR